MTRLFLSNLFLVVALNLLVKPFYIFGIDRTVQNLVGPETYGTYFALFNLAYLLQIFNDFGIQNFNHSVFSKHHNLIPKYLPRILLVKLILALGFVSIVVGIGLVVGYRNSILPLLGVIAINQVLVSMVAFFRTNLSASGYYRIDSSLSVLDKLLMIILVGWVIWRADPELEFRIEWFVFAQTLSLLITLAVSWILARAKLKIKLSKLRLHIAFLIWVLKRSLPYAMVLLLMTFYTRIDGIMLERLLPDGAYEAGVYAASYRILDAVNMIGVLVAGLLLPMFAKLLAKKRSVAPLVNTGFSMLIAGSLMVSVVSIYYGIEIISLLYTGANVYWGQVFQILMPSYLATSAGYVFGTLLTAHESIRQMNRIFLVGVVVNVLLNLLFIFWWKAWGAALATLITQSLVVTGLYLLCVRRIGAKLSGAFLGKLAGFVVLTIITAQLSYRIPLPWVAQAIVLILVSLGLSLLLGLFPFRRLFDPNMID